MRELSDQFFDTLPEEGDFDTVYAYICEHLDQIRELNLEVAIPSAALVLVRLPKIQDYIVADVFWSMSDRALHHHEQSIAVVEKIKATMAPEKSATFDDIIARHIVRMNTLRSNRSRLLFILRETNHACLAEEAELLLRSDHQNNVALSAFQSKCCSDQFHVDTHAFIRQHKDNLQKLKTLVDRSGPDRKRTHDTTARDRFTAIGATDSVVLETDGNRKEGSLPIDAMYKTSWNVSHPCRCEETPVSFSTSHNWRPINRLFDKFYTLEALQTIVSLFSTLKLYSTSKCAFTVVTRVDFNDEHAPIYAIPQTRLNYYYCQTCGTEYLAKYGNGVPLPPCREYPQGRLGTVMITDIIAFESPPGLSLLEYLDAQRQQ